MNKSFVPSATSARSNAQCVAWRSCASSTMTWSTRYPPPSSARRRSASAASASTSGKLIVSSI
ncbi:Uncharacterised protein [Mycobacteroides abscessus subsp. abscessus]|nr:Uncharacterised protein [Mycobacteroides abscessus subsp. abscessus]